MMMTMMIVGKAESKREGLFKNEMRAMKGMTGSIQGRMKE
jgi:hypothetical protein